MVKYDSLRKALVFKNMFYINGTQTWTQGVEIDLSHVNEDVRQLVIAVAKQSINFANGHKIVTDFIRKDKSISKGEPAEVKLEQVASSDVVDLKSTKIVP